MTGAERLTRRFERLEERIIAALEEWAGLVDRPVTIVGMVGSCASALRIFDDGSVRPADIDEVLRTLATRAQPEPTPLDVLLEPEPNGFLHPDRVREAVGWLVDKAGADAFLALDAVVEFAEVVRRVGISFPRPDAWDVLFDGAEQLLEQMRTVPPGSSSTPPTE